jgi:hypothetical protein
VTDDVVGGEITALHLLLRRLKVLDICMDSSQKKKGGLILV